MKHIYAGMEYAAVMCAIPFLLIAGAFLFVARMAHDAAKDAGSIKS